MDTAKDLIPDETPKAEPVCPGQATSQIALIANLYADGTDAAAWDAARPEATSSFVVSGSPYTSDGRPADVRIFFVKTAAHSWAWHVLSSQGLSAGELGNGSLTFDDAGALRAVEVSSPLRLARADGSLSAPISLRLGTPVSADEDGFDGMTSTPEPSQLHSYEQNGRVRDAAGDCSASR